MQITPVARRAIASLVPCILAAAVAGSAAAAPRAPEAFLGHEVGADGRLARWETIVEYVRHVAAESDRVAVRELGTTTGGLPMIWVEISAPETSNCNRLSQIATPLP